MEGKAALSNGEIIINGQNYKTFEELKGDADRINETNSSIRKVIAKQMEYTRIKCGITQNEFPTLLGISPISYYKFQTGAREVTIEPFLSFCRLFGLDMSTLIGREYWETSESVMSEVAAAFSGLSDETLDAIMNAVSDSHETAEKKHQIKVLVKTLKAFGKDENRVPFYAFNNKH